MINQIHRKVHWDLIWLIWTEKTVSLSFHLLSFLPPFLCSSFPSFLLINKNICIIECTFQYCVFCGTFHPLIKRTLTFPSEDQVRPDPTITRCINSCKSPNTLISLIMFLSCLFRIDVPCSRQNHKKSHFKRKVLFQCDLLVLLKMCTSRGPYEDKYRH